MGDSMPVLEQAVYVRQVRSGTAPRDGETSNFQSAPGVRCLSVSMRSGTEAGYAAFDLVPQFGEELAVESVFGGLRPGDQVRVRIPPYDAGIGAGQTLTIFHGVVEDVAGVVTIDGETVRYVARALPYLDNEGPEHVVTGRWMADANGDLIDVEAFDLPACFNHRGRPNRHASATFGNSNSALFTHDEDVDGEHWTVGEAMQSLLGRWLYGPPGSNTPRTTDLDNDSLSGGAYNAVLPEVNVHGLGVWDALQAVCDVSGFEMHLQMNYSGGSRPYALRIQRRGEGPFVSVGLPRRGQFPSSAGAVLQRAHVDQVRFGASAAPVRTEAQAFGAVRCECTIELRPMWRPDDVTTDATATEFAQRHVVGGDAFGDYRHVGRRWGVACVSGEVGYTSGDYAHDADGLDWFDELSIGGAMTAARQAAGVTADVAWARRPRRALPLSSREAREVGDRFLLEVSEDSGSSWARLESARFRTLRDGFGVELDLTDMATMSLATLADGPLVSGEDWWTLIDTQTLRFRLTCEVAADHTERARAEAQSGAGVLYPRMAMRRDRGVAVWASPGSELNTGSGWLRRTPADGDATADRLVDMADRARDGGESLSFRGTMSTWRMDFQRWRLGDRVKRLEGRNQGFGVATAGGLRFPTIGSIDVVLSGEGEHAAEAQRVTVGLFDSRSIGRTA